MRRLLVCITTVFFACSLTQPIDVVDAGSDALPLPADRTLTFANAAGIQVAPGTRVDIAVILRDAAGVPLPNVRVNFALLGEAHDASLSQIDGLTGDQDPDLGIARVSFLAPSLAATLRIRATADRAPAANLAVSVSARGFGVLDVTASYGGARVPAEVSLDLFDGIACSALAGADAVRSATLGAGGGEASFPGLPAGDSFAARATAIGNTGDELAHGCVDGLTFAAGASASVAVPFIDGALRVTGGYTATGPLDLGAVPTLAAAQWLAAVRGAVSPTGDEAEYLLEAVRVAVSTRAPSTLMLFESKHDQLHVLIARALATGSASPTATLIDFAADTALVAQSVVATTTFATTPSSGGMSALDVQAQSLTVDPLTPDTDVDDMSFDPGASGTVSAAVSNSDRVALAIRGLAMPFNTIARRSADALLARMAVGSVAEWAQINTHCSAIAALLTSSTGACDATCVTQACDGAVAALAHSLDIAIDETGVQHATVDVDFDGEATAIPGTLRVRAVASSPLVGAFSDDASLAVVGAVSVVGN